MTVLTAERSRESHWEIKRPGIYTRYIYMRSLKQIQVGIGIVLKPGITKGPLTKLFIQLKALATTATDSKEMS